MQSSDEEIEVEFVNSLADRIFYLTVANTFALRLGEGDHDESTVALRDWMQYLDKKYSKQLASRRKIDSPVALFRLQLLGTVEDESWAANIRASSSGI